MCHHVYTHHLCSHTSILQQRCDLTPFVFGAFFCDDYQITSVESNRFCSRDGTYCGDTVLGRRIDYNHHLLRLCRADLRELNQNIHDATSYTAQKVGTPGQLDAQESLLHKTPMSLERYNKQRHNVGENVRTVLASIKSSKIILAVQGLANQDVIDASPLATKTRAPQTPQSALKVGRGQNANRSFTSGFSPSQESPVSTPDRRPVLARDRSDLSAVAVARSITAKDSIQRAKSRVKQPDAELGFALSAAASAVRRSNRLSNKQQISYNEEDDSANSPRDALEQSRAEDGSPRKRRRTGIVQSQEMEDDYQEATRVQENQLSSAEVMSTSPDIGDFVRSEIDRSVATAIEPAQAGVPQRRRSTRVRAQQEAAVKKAPAKTVESGSGASERLTSKQQKQQLAQLNLARLQQSYLRATRTYSDVTHGNPRSAAMSQMNMGNSAHKDSASSAYLSSQSYLANNPDVAAQLLRYGPQSFNNQPIYSGSLTSSANSSVMPRSTSLPGPFTQPLPSEPRQLVQTPPQYTSIQQNPLNRYSMLNMQDLINPNLGLSSTPVQNNMGIQDVMNVRPNHAGQQGTDTAFDWNGSTLRNSWDTSLLDDGGLWSTGQSFGHPY